MRIAQAFTIKTVIPLGLAGALLSGLAVAGSSVIASVNTVPAASAVAAGAHLSLASSGAHDNMLFD